MKTIAALLRRLGLWIAIFAMDIQIDGYTKMVDWLDDINGDPITRGNIILARGNAKTERTRLRGEYNATFAPGKSRTWSAA